MSSSIIFISVTGNMQGLVRGCRLSSSLAGCNDQLNDLDDVRVIGIHPLLPPQILFEELPATSKSLKTVMYGRKDVESILSGSDDRLLVIVGPCSIHDTKAALEYATLLKWESDRYKDDLLLCMRVYFEKPRTTVGWKGLINDPDLDGSFKINKGLRLARQLLVDINDKGLICGSEFLDVISPQFIGDLITWGAIGARTTESQIHRELSSALSCPVGFKNGTGGSIDIAVDAIKSASFPHKFLSVTKQGLAAIVSSCGNSTCHIILRGGSDGPNYSHEHIKNTATKLRNANVSTSIIIDCSHGNSQKIHTNQNIVASDIARQVSEGNFDIKGVMIESNLSEGNQKLTDENKCNLKYGVSITDACIGWNNTTPLFKVLADAVNARRRLKCAL